MKTALVQFGEDPRLNMFFSELKGDWYYYPLDLTVREMRQELLDLQEFYDEVIVCFAEGDENAKGFYRQDFKIVNLESK